MLKRIQRVLPCLLTIMAWSSALVPHVVGRAHHALLAKTYCHALSPAQMPMAMPCALRSTSAPVPVQVMWRPTRTRRSCASCCLGSTNNGSPWSATAKTYWHLAVAAAAAVILLMQLLCQHLAGMVRRAALSMQGCLASRAACHR